MSDLFAPESSFLTTPHLIEGEPANARRSFYEIVKNRVRVVKQDDHDTFQKVATMSYDNPSAFFLIGIDDVDVDDNVERWLHVADISINEDYFILEKEDYRDIIPFVTEHELYEMWLTVKKGVKPATSDLIHMVARRKEFELVAEAGKADRLLEFYKKTGHVNISELEYAYNNVLKKRPK